MSQEQSIIFLIAAFVLGIVLVAIYVNSSKMSWKTILILGIISTIVSGAAYICYLLYYARFQ
mgnify:CR=1 FL=1